MQPAGNSAPSEIATQPVGALNPANGAAELAMAEDFLNGKTHPRNSEEAAKYLWRAVGKENPTAILLLSDLYQAGDGVPKSCDQARLLLSAAARKGVPQAAAKLGDLLRSGCPK
jgi:TPR repeat protein